MKDHPNKKNDFYGKNGWENCQELRNKCASIGISGIYYESSKRENGNNLVYWSLTSGAIDSSFFKGFE